MTTHPPLCPRCILGEPHDMTSAHPPIWPCLYCYLGLDLHKYCDPIRFACSCACGLTEETDP